MTLRPAVTVEQRAVEKRNRMMTSIYIDKKLWSEFRILVVEENTTNSRLLEQAVRELLDSRSRKERKT